MSEMNENKKKKKKRKPWARRRHFVVSALVFPFFRIYCKLKYGLTVHKHKDERRRQYFVLTNHQTAFDQFFMGMVFFPRNILYYVASEDLFSTKLVSKLLRFLVAPIPIKKQMTDVSAVMNCIRVAREGNSVAIAPEGNRTFSGRTGYMNPAIAGLCRTLKLPVAILHIEGGYGVHPRWSDVVRRGKMQVYVKRVLEPEEIRAMTDEELFDVLKEELYVDECRVDGVFRHKKRAEYLERAMYYCPECGLSRFHSEGAEIRCLKCGLTVRYEQTKELTGVGRPFPSRFVGDWWDAQCEYIKTADLSSFIDAPMYEEEVSFFEVIPYKCKDLLAKQAKISLYTDRFTVKTPTEERTLSFDDVKVVTILGKNKLNIYYKDKVYQLKGERRFNGVKYMNVYYRSKFQGKDNDNDGFLGI